MAETTSGSLTLWARLGFGSNDSPSDPSVSLQVEWRRENSADAFNSDCVQRLNFRTALNDRPSDARSGSPRTEDSERSIKCRSIGDK